MATSDDDDIKASPRGEDAGIVNDDDDDIDHVPHSGAPANWAEKRRLQGAVFDAWLSSASTKDVLQSKRSCKGQNEVDEEQSISSILAKHQKDLKIIRNPREYQIELFELATKQNTIAVLDTGSGKTLIAVLLLRWIIDKEMENRAQGQPPKVSFFLVPSVNLVFQQFSVLECNLDYDVGRLCGADGVDDWKRPSWDKFFKSKHTIVCTADILLHCLSKSHVTIERINLIIFDEAHHAKKNHAYARIIKDFYLAEKDLTHRPRIFGMTASPVDVKGNVTQAAAELELLLHSKIATTHDMSLSAAVKKPEEFILWYPPRSYSGHETVFLKTLKERYGHIDVFIKSLGRAQEVARDLGNWCTDTFLLQVFSDELLPRYELEIEQNFHAQSVPHVIKTLDDAKTEVQEAITWAQQQASQRPKSIAINDISPKVMELVQYLKQHFERQNDHRCIVFVNRRLTARMLHQFFAAFKADHTDHMYSDFLIGSRSGTLDDPAFTFRQQVLTLLKFHKGDTNCLFATSVAEEGLDVPDCNLVVRFDICKTMIQYIQSRGRARQLHSKFIHMAETGNSIHRQLMQETRYQEIAMREFCQQLPEDRFLIGNADSTEKLLEKEKTLRTYTEPSTGAKLTYGNALVCLASFVSAIPTDDLEFQHPTFVVSSKDQKFIAEVILPGTSPIRSVIGRLCSKKTLAKRSAAFEACVQLRMSRYLDEYLQPIYQKKLPALRNALLAVDMHKKAQYVNRTKPDIWAQGRGTLPSRLWMTIIDCPQGLDRSHRPLVLLTRNRMPQFPEFPIFPNDAHAKTVVNTPVKQSLRVTNETMDRFGTFTFRVLRDVFSKTYLHEPLKLSYWICPAVHQAVDENSIPENVIDWKLLDEVAAHDEFRWTPEMSNDFLINRFLVDIWDGSRKFYSNSINPSLKQTDIIPKDVAKSKWDGTILDYTVSLYKKARERAIWSSNQPIIEAEKLPTRRNMLAPPQGSEVEQRSRAVLCPEPLRISVLPTDMVTMAAVLPAVIHRLEAYLISLDGCEVVGVDCELSLALAAFTKDSDNSGDHEAQERINFQRGMGENYERLEFIGDTFLKLATSIATFAANPNENEFEFHVRRMQMLCNKNLFRAALDLKLYEFVRCAAFSRRLWYPEGIKLLEGKGAKAARDAEGSYHETQKHALGDKTIADICEAVIGAAYLSHNQQDGWKPQQWENAIRAVTKLVDSDDHRMMTWDDYRTTYEKPAYQIADATAAQRFLAAKVEKEHDYHFQYPRLLYSAFLHPSMSYMAERMPNYQRLEFLGDALLDMVSVAHLAYQHPSKDPQWLTEHKMAMASNQFLGALCVILGFHRHLRHSQAALDTPIRAYVAELTEARALAGPDRRDFWTTVGLTPPKCLPDMVEAYVGAIFVDSDFDFAVVQRFFDQHIRWFFEDMRVYDGFAHQHPCARLHAVLETQLGCGDFRVMAREVPAVDRVDRMEIVAVVMVHDRIIAHGVGSTGRSARMRAAAAGLEVVDGLVPAEYREKFGCLCQVTGQEGSERGDYGADCGV